MAGALLQGGAGIRVSSCLFSLTVYGGRPFLCRACGTPSEPEWNVDFLGLICSHRVDFCWARPAVTPHLARLWSLRQGFAFSGPQCWVLYRNICRKPVHLAYHWWVVRACFLPRWLFRWWVNGMTILKLPHWQWIGWRWRKCICGFQTFMKVAIMPAILFVVFSIIYIVRRKHYRKSPVQAAASPVVEL